jgi:GNAT superfamily N-acetyltransferase
MPYAPSAHSPADLRDWVCTRLIPSGGVTVAAVAGRVVGVLAVSTEAGRRWIDQLYLDPHSVGQGIGTQLLEFGLEFGIAASALPIRLYTFQANLGARRFYERHGFVAIALTDGQGNEEKCPDVLYERVAPAGISG